MLKEHFINESKTKRVRMLHNSQVVYIQMNATLINMYIDIISLSVTSDLFHNPNYLGKIMSVALKEIPQSEVIILIK